MRPISGNLSGGRSVVSYLLSCFCRATWNPLTPFKRSFRNDSKLGHRHTCQIRNPHNSNRFLLIFGGRFIEGIRIEDFASPLTEIRGESWTSWKKETPFKASNTVKERLLSRQKLGIRRATRQTATPRCRFRLDISCSVKLIHGVRGGERQRKQVRKVIK